MAKSTSTMGCANGSQTNAWRDRLWFWGSFGAFYGDHRRGPYGNCKILHKLDYITVYDGHHKIFSLFIGFDVKKWWFGVTFSFCDGLRKSVKTIVLCLCDPYHKIFGGQKYSQKGTFCYLKNFYLIKTAYISHLWRYFRTNFELVQRFAIAIATVFWV